MQSTFITMLASGALAAAVSTGSFAQVSVQPLGGDPLPGLTADQLDRFFKGANRFAHDFTAEEGLGPTFNQTSCAVCHQQPADGGSGSIAVFRFGARDVFGFGPNFDPLEEFGGSLHQMGTILVGEEPGDLDCSDLIPTQEDVEDLLGFDWVLWGPISRITNSTFGAGLVEAIDDANLLAHAVYFADGTPNGVPAGGSPPPAPLITQSPVAGHAHMVHSFEDFDPNDERFIPDPRVGRMGWKAQVATVLTFSADAARNEMGISNRFIPHAPAPKGDPDLLAECENIPGVNDMALHPNDQPQLDPFGENVEFIDRITDFQRFLSPPPQTPRSGMTGEALFMDIGCGQCHVPSFTTRDDPALEDAIRNKVIKPYSDFLLHDMGMFGDGIVQADASGDFIRTPALWGLRFRNPLMHNGMVGDGHFEDLIHQAIEFHREEFSTAAAAANAFFGDSYPGNQIALNADERALVVDFLASLGRREFDSTGDNFVGDSDFADLITCYTGPHGSYVADPCPTPGPGVGCDNPMDHPCAVFDINQNGRIDETDFAAFLIVYDGALTECELWLDLAHGSAEGTPVPVPGDCIATCTADVNLDGVVDIFDLLTVLSNWGPCLDPENCPADISGDGVADIIDLLLVLSHWGPCPN